MDVSGNAVLGDTAWEKGEKSALGGKKGGGEGRPLDSTDSKKKMRRVCQKEYQYKKKRKQKKTYMSSEN